jgi:hypothetical protein
MLLVPENGGLLLISFNGGLLLGLLSLDLSFFFLFSFFSFVPVRGGYTTRRQRAQKKTPPLQYDESRDVVPWAGCRCRRRSKHPRCVLIEALIAPAG